jgi:hypothetical protein
VRVGGHRDGARELLLTGRRADGDDLAALEIRSVHGKLGESKEAVVHGRRS